MPLKQVHTAPLSARELSMTAVSLISEGVKSFNHISVTKGSKLQVDVAASLNTELLTLDKIVKILKDDVKTKILTLYKGQLDDNDTFILDGYTFNGVVSKFFKTYPDMGLIKEHFGKNWDKYVNHRTEYQLSFKPKLLKD